jgi:hypothetical protein
MITHSLTSAELDVLEAKFRAESATATSVAAELTWLAAVDLIAAVRRESFQKRIRAREAAHHKNHGQTQYRK